MFEITATATFHNDAGAQTKEPRVYHWVDLEKKDVISFERQFNKAMMRMTDMADDVHHGKLPKGGLTNPVEMRLDVVVLEDGAKWLRATYEWPKMGEEGQGMFFGVMDGELAKLSNELKKFKPTKPTQGKGKV